MEKISYENINQELKDILSRRIDRKATTRFKVLVKALKEDWKISISKEFIKYTLFDDKSPSFQKVLTTRINRILKKEEIQTEKHPRFFKSLTSEKGILYYEYRKKYFAFLMI